MWGHTRSRVMNPGMDGRDSAIGDTAGTVLPLGGAVLGPWARVGREPRLQHADFAFHRLHIVERC